jgi:two-component system response regulator AgrA
MMEDLDMKIVLATAMPGDILAYIKKTSVAGLYFLDIDLGREMNGIKLAEAIREYDPRGFIVFITADAGAFTLTFKYKLEAMDYIVKNEINIHERICECIRSAYDRYTAKTSPLQPNFVFKSPDGVVIALNFAEIVYFEVCKDMPHRVMLHTQNGLYNFRGNLADIIGKLGGDFYRCHRAFIVNLKKIKKIDAAMMKMQMENGAEIEVAAKYIKKTAKLIQQ